MGAESATPADLPAKAGQFARTNPEVWAAYAALGAACAAAGPLDPGTQRLIKLALAIGANSEGAVHSHARRALQEGSDADALRQVPTLAIPTAGFPAAMRALTWIEDVIEASCMRDGRTATDLSPDRLRPPYETR